MLFNSFTFLLFFALVLLLHNLPLPWRWKKTQLLLASYLFYAAWNPPFVVLLWISTLTDWFVGRGMAAAVTKTRRRGLLFVSLGVNLGLLAYFKYAGFLLDSFASVVRTLGVDYEPAMPDIILPLGISFYTFQTLSYTLSIYRGESRPSRSFLDYALFVTFFPQLVAGPIVRSTEFLPQCAMPKRADARQMGWGLALLTFGLFQKTVLADALLAPTADLVFNAAGSVGTLDAWVGTLAFSGQIFFDFAGYSSCAIGAALCLGFILPENFHFPYAALGFSDFWRRWHISLSSWLRDYVYITVGGNRLGIGRTYINLMFTMLLGGLWHGASWHFVVWGGLHGTYLAIERLLRPHFTATLVRPGMRRLGMALFTFLLISVTWIFFRAQTFGDALQIVLALVGGVLDQPDSQLVQVTSWHVGQVLFVLTATFVVQFSLRDADLENRFSALPLVARSILLTILLLSILVAPGDDRAFIYFQF
ncbi:MAG: MBOAT family protein [Gammaproteobacteria bacterium]|nr:MAG: MBOAT family protein [Gammaproteobacteria bacterium]